MVIPNSRYIDTAQALDATCADCESAEILAIDTEFERTSTYFAKPALLQLFDGHTVYLLDPLAIDDLSAFSRLLHQPQAELVMHAASEDIGLLKHITGKPLTGLFDTQIAAGFCGLEYGLGYHRLAQELLAVEVSKTQTRSDWLRRPLSTAQLQYAALDVYYLPALHNRLCERLETLDRTSWLREEMRLFLDRVEIVEAQRDYQKLLKSLPDDSGARSRLQHLCEWRDRLARRRNAPRRQLLEDGLLLAIASAPALDASSLDDLRQHQRTSRRARHGDLEAALEFLATAPLLDLPPAVQNLGCYRKLLREMQDIVRARAKQLNVSPALLASKRMLENFILHVHILEVEDLPVEFSGWRREILAEPLQECLHHA